MNINFYILAEFRSHSPNIEAKNNKISTEWKFVEMNSFNNLKKKKKNKGYVITKTFLNNLKITRICI